MNIEDKIQALLAKAEPLRCLPDDEPAKAPLTALVDEINKLRAKQADELLLVLRDVIEGADAEEPAKRPKLSLPKGEKLSISMAPFPEEG